MRKHMGILWVVSTLLWFGCGASTQPQQELGSMQQASGEFVHSQSTHSVTATASTFAPGSNITANWTAPYLHSNWDWIGLYEVGTGSYSYLSWVYVGNSENTSGTVSLSPIASPSPTTQYELRYYLDNGYTLAATSAPFYIRQSQGTCNGTSDWADPTSGRCYTLLTQTYPLGWSMARDWCRNVGSDLATFGDVNHIAYVLQNATFPAHGQLRARVPDIWIGALKQDASTLAFNWIDGSGALPATPWAAPWSPGYPQNSGDLCVAIRSDHNGGFPDTNTFWNANCGSTDKITLCSRPL